LLCGGVVQDCQQPQGVLDQQVGCILPASRLTAGLEPPGPDTRASCIISAERLT